MISRATSDASVWRSSFHIRMRLKAWNKNFSAPPSKWMPPKGRDATLESYVRGVRIDVQNQVKKLCRVRCRDNLSSLERSALIRLQRREDIVIKPADKGSALVVLNRGDYIEKAQSQLSNANHYKDWLVIPPQPTPWRSSSLWSRCLNEGWLINTQRISWFLIYLKFPDCIYFPNYILYM